jgi:large subunit ribosomal protein L22
MSTGIKKRAERRRQMRDKRPFAVARYIRIASSKMELVLDLIRGKDYETAVAILKNTNKSSSPVILKVLASAGANAENNLSLMKDSLYVAECYSMAGPTLKRMMPRAKGRGDRILKRTCHLKIVLDVREVKKTIKSTKVKAEKKTEGVKKVEKKEVPTITAEKPLTERANTSKPLGTKKALTGAAVKTPAKTTSKMSAGTRDKTPAGTTVTPAKTQVKKAAAKEEAK